MYNNENNLQTLKNKRNINFIPDSSYIYEYVYFNN